MKTFVASALIGVAHCLNINARDEEACTSQSQVDACWAEWQDDCWAFVDGNDCEGVEFPEGVPNGAPDELLAMFESGSGDEEGSGGEEGSAEN